MNFLELCKKTRHESRVSGSGPATVESQTGILGDVVEAVRDAWIELQHYHSEWRFLEHTKNAVLIAGTGEYHFGDLGINDFKTLKSIFVNGDKLQRITWERYVEISQSLQSETGRPCNYCISPSGSLVVSPVPDKLYQVLVHYYSTPQRLIKNADVPNIPESYHSAIIWRAVMDLSANESDSVIYQKAASKYEFEFDRLAGDFLPEVKLGGSF